MDQHLCGLCELGLSVNTNETLAAAAFALTFGVSGLAAYGLRYVPISGDGLGTPVLVWDRWTQEVCQVSLLEDYPIHCSRSNPCAGSRRPPSAILTYEAGGWGKFTAE